MSQELSDGKSGDISSADVRNEDYLSTTTQDFNYHKVQDGSPATTQDFNYHKGQDSSPANSDNVPGTDKGSTQDKEQASHISQHQSTPRNKSRTVSFNDSLYESKQNNRKKDTNSNKNKTVKQRVVIKDDDSGVPYDRGWAWMVDLGCFLVFFVYISHDQWHSVLLLDYLQEFNISVSLVTIMMAIGNVCYCVATQISTNILVVRYSIRVVTTCAAIVNVVATLIFAAAPNVGTFFIVNCIKYTAKGITLTATLVLVGLYFRRRRGLATTLGFIGVSSSFICAPPLIRYLREEYGFRGCFLILAGLEMHGILAALLLRPISSYKRKKTSVGITNLDREESKPLITNNLNELPEEDIVNVGVLEHLHVSPVGIAEISIEESDELASDSSDMMRNILEQNEVTKFKDKSNSSKEEVVKMKNGIKSDGASDETKLTTIIDCDRKDDVNNRKVEITKLYEQTKTGISDSNNVSKQNRLENNSNERLKNQGEKVMVEDKAHKVGSENNVEAHSQEFSSQNQVSEMGSLVKVERVSVDSPQIDIVTPIFYHASNLSLVTTSTMSNIIESQLSIDRVSPEQRRQYCWWLKELISVELLKNYLAVMVAVMYILINTGIFSVVYLPTYAKRVGVSSSNAAILLTIVGSMDMIGRLAFGFLADLKLLRPNYIIAFTCACIGTVTHFVVLFDGLEKLIFFAVMHGLLAGVGQNLTTVLIVDVLGIQYLSKLLSMSSMFNSVSLIIQHPLQGAIIEATGNFVTTYHYVGTSFILAALLLICEPFIRKLQVAKEKKQGLEAPNSCSIDRITAD